jgi:hypothetical protein
METINTLTFMCSYIRIEKEVYTLKLVDVILTRTPLKMLQ